MKEIEKMAAGMWYDANYDPEIIEERYKCMDLCYQLNMLKPSDRKQKMKLLNNY